MLNGVARGIESLVRRLLRLSAAFLVTLALHRLAQRMSQHISRSAYTCCFA